MRPLALACLLAASCPIAAAPLGTAFTYQGRLDDNGQAANGLYDFEFCLYDSLTGGALVACSPTGTSADLPVADGLFTASIDADNWPFNGEKRFLEIRVRQGASAGAFETLSPRQLITAVPEALRAASVASGQVGTQQINSTQVQARVLGSCQNQTFMTSVSQDGSVGCTGINLSSIQARVTGTCAPGSFVNAVSESGTVSCSSATSPAPAVTTAISTGDKSDVSVAIGADGLPVITLRDVASANINTFKCGNSDCTAPGFGASIDTGLNSSPAIALRSDNRPVVSYFDVANDVLKLAICSNANCAGANVIINLDSTIQVGTGTSVVLAPGDLPIVAYHTAIGEIKIARCFTETCSGAIQRTTVDTVGLNGRPSIALAQDGLPMLSYNDVNQQDLKFAKCQTVLCQAPADVSIRVLDSANVSAAPSALALGLDGHPVVSYSAASPAFQRFIRCNLLDCFASGPAQTIDAGASSSATTSMTIASNGNPVITFADTANGLFKVAKCINSSCGAAAVAVIDSGTAGNSSDVVMGTDGLPLLAYTKPGLLKFAKCATSSCQ